MSTKTKRAALYTRVSTLTARRSKTRLASSGRSRSAAAGRSWRFTETPASVAPRAEISAQGLTRCSTTPVGGVFDVVMAWAIDRLGRSLIGLLGTIQHLEAVGVYLYLEQQHLDTTPPAGKLLFQITGAFGEFERSMIRQRVKAGLAPIKAKIARGEKFTSKAGTVRHNLGRPGAEPDKMER